jgi:hypothetical protein
VERVRGAIRGTLGLVLWGFGSGLYRVRLHVKHSPIGKRTPMLVWPLVLAME